MMMDDRVPNLQRSLPVVIEPHPVQQRAGLVGTIMASLGMTAVVVLVLYGLSRPEGPQQTASAPSETASGQTAQPAPAGNAGGQNQQAAKPEPSTTGQGQGGDSEKPQPDQGKAERSDSATTGAKPGDQPKPPQ
jgi:hypothetical protein